MRNCKTLWVLCLGVFAALGLKAQPKINDPYTLLGLGNVSNLNFVPLQGMPGLTATYHHPYMMNVQNPAASSHLAMAAFEAGGNYEYKISQAPDATEQVHTGNLRYFGLGFPLFNRLNRYDKIERRKYNLGMTFSLSPYTELGYNLQQQSSVLNAEGDTVTNVLSRFQGNGSTYKLMWGNSIRYENFSFGVNLGYLFGTQNTEEEDLFDGLSFPFVNLETADTRLSGFVWNAGLLYEYILPYEKEFDKYGKEKLKPKTRLTLGLYGNSTHSARATASRLLERRQQFGAGFVSDTLSGEGEEVKGSITLPAEFGVGVMISKDARWRLGIDYTYTGWSGYSNELDDDNLQDAHRIAVGAEITPNPLAPFRQYGKRITYRIGGYFERDPRDLSAIGLDENLTRRAVTFGVSLPLQPDLASGNLISFMNLGAEIGQYGSSDYIRQTYFRINIGFTLNDNRWFYRSKYN